MIMGAVEIVELTPELVPICVELGERMHEESEFRDLDYDRRKLTYTGLDFVESDDRCGFVAIRNEVVIGMVLGMDAEYYFGRDRAAFDWLWYVVPEYRGSLVAVKLLAAFRSWAIARGCKEIRIGASTGVEVERTHEMMTRLGWDHVGGNYREKL